MADSNNPQTAEPPMAPSHPDYPAKAHFDAVNASTPGWLKSRQTWTDLSEDEKEHHRTIARAVLKSAIVPTPSVPFPIRDEIDVS